VLKEVLQAALRQHLTNTIAENRLKDLLTSLKNAGGDLSAAVARFGSDLDTMLTSCLNLTLVPTVTGAFLHLCATDSNLCLEQDSQNGLHVGCCCGVIPAIKERYAAGKGSSRRMQEVQEGETDACLYAR